MFASQTCLRFIAMWLLGSTSVNIRTLFFPDQINVQRLVFFSLLKSASESMIMLNFIKQIAGMNFKKSSRNSILLVIMGL